VRRMRLTLINPLYEINMNLNKWNNKTNKQLPVLICRCRTLEITHTHADTMFEQHAGSHTHNLLNRARGGTLLCTRGPCPLVTLASYGPACSWKISSSCVQRFMSYRANREKTLTKTIQSVATARMDNKKTRTVIIAEQDERRTAAGPIQPQRREAVHHSGVDIQGE